MVAYLLMVILFISTCNRKGGALIIYQSLFSSPGRSPGRAIVLPPGVGVGVGVGGGVGVSKMLKFYVKVFYVMGKALSGELSCPRDRLCFSI